MTNKQKQEIECLNYFCLSLSRYKKSYNNKGELDQKKRFIKIRYDKNGDSPEDCYFKITDMGLKDIVCNNANSLYRYIDGKKWRLRMVDMYEQGLLYGDISYYTILGLENVDETVPPVVVKFIAKTMFKGADYKLITNLYKDETGITIV